MTDTVPGYSWTQGLSTLTGAMPQGGDTNPSGPANIIAALIRKIKGGGSTPGLGRFEGDVASPANPYESGVYGMQSPQAQASPGMSPSVGGAGQPSPWTAGASPTPYTDPTMTALFSQPPIG